MHYDLRQTLRPSIEIDPNTPYATTHTLQYEAQRVLIEENDWMFRNRVRVCSLLIA